LQTFANVNIPHTGDIERSTSRPANQIGPMLHMLISMKGFASQKLTIEKFLKQPILKEAMLDVVVKSKLYETTYEIVGNLKERWMGIKGCHTIDDMKARNVLTNMVVSNSIEFKSSGPTNWDKP